MMRRILVDYARRRRYAKRGGGALKVSLGEVADISAQRAAYVMELDAALTTLAEVDERKSRIVELRFFGGLSLEETAEVRISEGTVRREWSLVKAWLQREISRKGG